MPKALLRLDGADPINRGLIAFWPLADGGGAVARDISQRRRHGAMEGFTTNRSTVGSNGKALTFDASNDYINLNGRWMAGLSQASFSCRFRPNAGNGYLYYEDGGGFNNFAVPCPAPGSSALDFNIGSNTSRLSSVRTWAASAWYDLVITWGADIRVYVNGMLDNTIAATVSTSTNPGDNDQIGRYSFGGGINGNYTPATISNVRLFRRVLTAAEVARLYRDPWAGTARRRLPWDEFARYEAPPPEPSVTVTTTFQPHGVLRRRVRRQMWANVPEELKPVVALAEEWTEADPVRRAVDEALAAHARMTARTTALRRERLIDDARRAIIAAVERAAEMDDEEALIALL